MAQALIDISVEIFNGGESLSLDIGALFAALRAFGLHVVGSAPSPSLYATPYRAVRLIVAEIAAPVLPKECAEGWHIVILQLTLETNGDQRLLKISGVSLGDRPRMVLAP